MKKGKIVWVNVLKFIGIFCIYVGHFNTKAGSLYKFVFYFHVPLFFFIAGFFDDIHDLSFKEYLKKNLKRLIIPYFVMELIYLIVLIVTSGVSLGDVPSKLLYTILGMKDKLPANSLWFIPCLFSIKMTNYGILKIANKIKYKKLFPIVVSLVFYFFVRYFLFKEIGLTGVPKLVWSIDGVFWYYIYFIIGKYTFDYLKKLLKPLKKKSTKEKLVFYGLFIFSLAFTALCYYKGLDCHKLKITQLVALCLLLKTSILILFNCYLAYMLSRIRFIGRKCDEIGSNTLYLCGTEQLIKYGFKGAQVVLFGEVVVYGKPIYVVIYTLFLLIFDNYLIIPIMKKIVTYVDIKISLLSEKIKTFIKRTIHV